MLAQANIDPSKLGKVRFTDEFVKMVYATGIPTLKEMIDANKRFFSEPFACHNTAAENAMLTTIFEEMQTTTPYDDAWKADPLNAGWTLL